MSATLLQTLPWYWRLVHRIQGAIDTGPEQYLATVVVGLLFLLTVWLIYLGGRPLKRRFSDEAVEIARTMTVMVVALATAALVVVVWQSVGQVLGALVTFGNTLVPGAETGVKIFVAFIALLGTYTLTRVTKRVIRYWFEGDHLSPHQRELAHHSVQLCLFFVAVLFIFVLFEFNPRDLFVGAGVVGIVIGFAARKTLSDVLAGFVLLFGRPFEAGDWIAVGEREGIVTEITVFNTQVRTFNEEHVLIPNDSVTDRELVNYSKTDRLRLITEVGVDYDADVAAAAEVATGAMEDCEEVIDSPNPDVVLESFDDSAVVLQLRYWIDRPTIQRKLSAQNEVIDAVKSAFEAEGIKIPYPQRELMGREEADGFRVASDGEMSVEGELEQAVRHVEADSTSTTVEEPVEKRYGDGEDDGVSEDGGDSKDDRDSEADPETGNTGGEDEREDETADGQDERNREADAVKGDPDE